MKMPKPMPERPSTGSNRVDGKGIGPRTDHGVGPTGRGRKRSAKLGVKRYHDTKFARWMEHARRVITLYGDEIMAGSMEDIVRAINDYIPDPGDCISYKSWERWVTRDNQAGSDDSEARGEDDEILDEFRRLHQGAMYERERRLVRNIMDCSGPLCGQWQRYAFLLERRYRERWGRNERITHDGNLDIAGVLQRAREAAEEETLAAENDIQEGYNHDQ